MSNYNFTVLKYDDLFNGYTPPEEYQGIRSYDGYVLPNELIYCDWYLTEYRDLLSIFRQTHLFDMLVTGYIDWEIISYKGQISTQYIGIKANNSFDDLNILDEKLHYLYQEKPSITATNGYKQWYENIWLRYYWNSIGTEYFLSYVWEKITTSLDDSELKESESAIQDFLINLLEDELSKLHRGYYLVTVLSPHTLFEKYQGLIFAFAKADKDFLERYYASINPRQLQLL